MKRSSLARPAVGIAVLAIGLVSVSAMRCASSQQKAQEQAMAKSTALVDALKKRSIPGLPAALTAEQALEIDRARTGPGGWFVETGCFACHNVSVYGVKSYAQIGPDLSTAVDDVKSRFGKNIDEFWHEPVGTMMMVRSSIIKLSPDEEALALQKLKTASDDYKRAKAANSGESSK